MSEYSSEDEPLPPPPKPLTLEPAGPEYDSVIKEQTCARLSQFRLELGLTQEEMANKLHMNQRTYAHYENGRFPPTKILSRLAREGFNVQWLLTGEGPMAFEGQSQEEEDSGWRDSLATPPGKSNLVPIFPLGHTDEGESEPIGEWADRRWIRSKYEVDPERLRSTVAGSDAMEETISRRDRLRVVRWKRQDSFVDGRIYVLQSEAGRSIRRLQIAGDGMHVRCDNPAYQNDTLSLDDFQERYEVAAWVIEVIRPI